MQLCLELLGAMDVQFCPELLGDRDVQFCPELLAANVILLLFCYGLQKREVKERFVYEM